MLRTITLALALLTATTAAAEKRFAGDAKPWPGEAAMAATLSAARAEATPASTRPVTVPRSRPLVTGSVSTAAKRMARPPVGRHAAAPCLAAARIDEPDIRRHRTALAGSCIRKHRFREGGRPWTVYTMGEGRPGPLWAVLHDDEDAGFDAAVVGMRRHGGTILAVETGERRMNGTVDPNRNFGTACGPATRYTALVMGLARRHGRVVAVHSNKPGFWGDRRGGRGNISVYRKSRVLRGRPAKRARGAFRSGDNFVLIAARNERAARRRIAAVNRRGIHAMFERVAGRGDCSLSNHIVLHEPMPFVNIEVRDGASRTAIRMIDPALEALR